MASVELESSRWVDPTRVRSSRVLRWCRALAEAQRVRVARAIVSVALLAAGCGNQANEIVSGSESASPSTHTSPTLPTAALNDTAPACAEVLKPGQTLPDDLYLCQNDAGELSAIVTLEYECSSGDTFSLVNADGVEGIGGLAFLGSDRVLHDFSGYQDGALTADFLELQERACVEWTT